MKLLAKFNLIFIAVFGIGMIVAVSLAYSFLRTDAKNRVLADARLMMETTLATRSYTAKQIRPVLPAESENHTKFRPQTVPAYAATEIFNYLHQRYTDYSYKEATLNPTNPRDRAVDWEADVVNSFRSHPEQREFIGERNTPFGAALYLARPIQILDPKCLECHSTAANAPVSMIHEYGPNNGFGWNNREIIGAQIVSIPESLPIQIADRALRTLVLYLVIIAAATLLTLDAVLIATVIRPVARLSNMADEISRGKVEIEALPVKGKDEIAVLASSFNRMQRSLASAMKMLESESEPDPE